MSSRVFTPSRSVLSKAIAALAGSTGKPAGLAGNRQSRWTDDQGANPIELVILLPVIVVTLFTALQMSMLFMARSEALSAANAGVEAQRAYGAQNGAYANGVTSYLDGGPGWFILDDVSVPTDSATEVTVTVTGHSFSMVPFWDGFSVTESVHGSKERVTSVGNP